MKCKNYLIIDICMKINIVASVILCLIFSCQDSSNKNKIKPLVKKELLFSENGLNTYFVSTENETYILTEGGPVSVIQKGNDIEGHIFEIYYQGRKKVINFKKDGIVTKSPEVKWIKKDTLCIQTWSSGPFYNELYVPYKSNSPNRVLSKEMPRLNSGVIKEEEFSTNKIGIKDSFRVTLKQIRCDDSIFVEIRLFRRELKKWKLTQMQTLEKDGVTSLNAKTSDFNNDGFLDLTFQTSTAARGANEVRTLFIFDTINKQLIRIKNSDDYPNLRYNSTLDCIDAFLVYGGTSTVFLKLEKDSLKEFAEVSLFDGRISVSTLNYKGIRKYIIMDKIYKTKTGEMENWARFETYQPLKERKSNY